jgi:hypothetical protein
MKNEVLIAAKAVLIEKFPEYNVWSGDKEEVRVYFPSSEGHYIAVTIDSEGDYNVKYVTGVGPVTLKIKKSREKRVYDALPGGE